MSKTSQPGAQAQALPQDMRSRILATAAPLFHRHGYKGFSYQEIARELGVKHSAIHYHFPAKADLGVALIETMRDQVRAMSAGSGLDVRIDYAKQLHTFFDYYRGHADLHDGALCPIGAMAIEAASAPVPVQMQMRLLIKEVLAFLTRVLAKGRDAGQFAFEGSASEKALLVLSVLTGALQIARYAGPEFLEQGIAQIEAKLTA